ncbi:hypothetical protein TNCV_763491 [Trichonephila clavipes]|nr:hypothetical protein TNCV_763491 [Trichonephila clavipes]
MILMKTDGLFIGLLCKAVSTSATFVWTLYPIASSLQSIQCQGIVAPSVLSLMHLVLFYLDISAEMNLSPAMRFCREIKFHYDYSLLLEKSHAATVVFR